LYMRGMIIAQQQFFMSVLSLLLLHATHATLHYSFYDTCAYLSNASIERSLLPECRVEREREREKFIGMSY